MILTSNSKSNMGKIMNWDSLQLKTHTHIQNCLDEELELVRKRCEYTE